MADDKKCKKKSRYQLFVLTFSHDVLFSMLLVYYKACNTF